MSHGSRLPAAKAFLDTRNVKDHIRKSAAAHDGDAAISWMRQEDFGKGPVVSNPGTPAISP